MGFSVSASSLVMFIAFLIAATVLWGAASSSFSDIAGAEKNIQESIVDSSNTKFNVTNVTQNDTTDEITFNVTNTGTTRLQLSEVTALVDGKYVNLSVNSHSGERKYILPGEEFNFSVADNVPAGANRLVFVGPHGKSKSRTIK